MFLDVDAAKIPPDEVFQDTRFHLCVLEDLIACHLTDMSPGPLTPRNVIELSGAQVEDASNGAIRCIDFASLYKTNRQISDLQRIENMKLLLKAKDFKVEEPCCQSG